MFMKKSFFLSFSFMIAICAFALPDKGDGAKLTNEQALAWFNLTSGESYQRVMPKNILSEGTYVNLAKEGWTVGEIIRLTDDYLTAHKADIKKAGTHIDYSKHWRPYNVSANVLNSTLQEYTDPVGYAKAKLNVEATQDDPNAYFPRVFYTPADRLAGVRNTGYFRHNAIMPAGGRIHWIAVNPNNADRLMVVPDAEGIWRTDDMGAHWDCITERIPNRYDRNHSDSYSIPVDPDNWDNIYAFMGNSTVYQTLNGGTTWRKILGATHKGFKRGYCFRDAAGKLKFIGAKPTQNNGIGAQLWLSSDTCKTWTSVNLTDAQKDITVSGTKTFWFQEIAFHPTNRDIIYSAGSRGILRSINGGTTWERMSFRVYGATTATIRSASTDLFPLATANTPMFLAINPNNGNEMWAALSTRENAGSSALYKTTDGGANWITLQEPSAVPAIGSGGIFGNESAWNWLGGFAVNFVDQTRVYGCSMSSAESTNSGVTFTEFAWPNRSTGYYPDRSIFPVSSASHNADNHVLIGHKSGRIFRGGDAGLIMKDKNINGYNWTNISGNMGEMMFYTSTTNEFGDFAITGNTQDINIETYRGGRWGSARGYEGSTIWMNPFSGEEHFPYLTSGGTAIQNQDYGSWSRAWTLADVCTGNWYIRREGANPDGSKFSVIKDFGKTSIALDNATAGFVQDFALSRDVASGKLFFIQNNKLFYSLNSGATSRQINTGTFNPTKVAVNPDDSKEIYIAKDGAVSKTKDGGTTWQTISTSTLSGVTVKSFYYHEGSGDLYFVSAVHGIFILEAGTTTWRLWTKGYNTAKLADAQINYTTQEMLITDYGSGLWIADLQHPADRYLKAGFTLKQTSNINNARTFGVNVTFAIPLYYYYKWYVNGVLQTKEKGQFFTSSTLVPNDVVKLEVTLRESPDVKTTSANFVVQDETTTSVVDARGNCLYSNQKGRLDLGYVDHFFGNFTLQMWVNPKSNGVILANRQVKTNAVKGFYLSIDAGRLTFAYTPENNFVQPMNETAKTMHFSIDGGLINMNSWSQVTVSHDRAGNITIYVNGILRATRARQASEFTLNNSLYLSLFADAYEVNELDASVDELKIWDDVLDQTTIRKSMFGAVSPSTAKLIYYNDFNAATLSAQKERFSQQGMAPKTKAQIEIKENASGICASTSDYKALGTTWTAFSNNAKNDLEIRSSSSAFLPSVNALFYNTSVIGNNSNLKPAYHTIYPYGFGIKMFDVTDLTKTLDIKFYLDPALAAEYQGASLYALSLTADIETWTLLSPVTYSDLDKSVSVLGIKASEVDNKRFVLVKAKPAIELTSSAISLGADLPVYSPDVLNVPFQATLVGGLTAPTPSYSVLGDNPIVSNVNPLIFTGNTATTVASVQLQDNNMFGQKSVVNITGEDAKMIPYTFSVLNKITPAANEKGIKINLGGANVGTASTFADLSGKNTATYMAWVRLDNASMLTGYRMLLFFRGTGTNATGVVLKDGKIGCHWNDESWSWDVNSGLALTTADVGKWVHIAMTAAPTGLNFYLNGKKGVQVGSGLSKPVINVPLMIGKNFDADANFVGSVDQVSIWNRTLSPIEIVKYMHSRAFLNEPGLVAYVPFENEAVGGGYTELKSGANTSFSGVVTANSSIYVPFSFLAQETRTKAANDGIVSDGISFTLPTGYPTSNNYFTSRFAGTPYNGIDTKYPKQVALEGAYRTISFAAIRNFTAAERIQFTIENSNIAAGDSVIFYARALGDESSFKTRYSVLAIAGKASFEVPATLFNDNLTYVFYRLPLAPNAVDQLSVRNYRVSVENSVCTFHNLRGNAKISFLDLSGKFIKSIQSHNSQLSVKMDKGMYVLKIEESGYVCMGKVVI